MSALYAISYDAQAAVFHVSGDLLFASANAVLTESEKLFDKSATLNVDLEQVNRSDSAGLAILIDWMRKAKQKGKPIRFHNMPAQMLALAKASGLDELLPLQ